MLKSTTKSIIAPIATGEYTATYVRMQEGKTPADTILVFHLNEVDRNVNVFVNNSRVCFTDEQGEKFTSEDFFFIGLKRQLKMYNDIDPMSVLNICINTPVTLWVVAGDYTNVYSSKPKNYDSADLGIC
jgi:hypothetical protein